MKGYTQSINKDNLKIWNCQYKSKKKEKANFNCIKIKNIYPNMWDSMRDYRIK